MSGPSAATTSAAIARLLDAIASRDLRTITSALGPAVTWQNVPHRPTVGRDAVVAHLAGVITWSDEVRWEVLTEHHESNRAWLERIDRFLIGSEWHAVRCNGIFEIDDEGRVGAVRDYVDLGEWRQRVGPVLDRLANRPAVDVVQRHLDAVGTGDVVAMAADYAVDATIVRGNERYEQWGAIAEYFEGVPARLGDCRVTFHDVAEHARGEVVTRWSIIGDGAAAGTSGADTFVVADGRIVHQVVVLDGHDF